MSQVTTPSDLSHAVQRAVAVGIAVCAVAGALAQAQSVYRIVGPDGKVTFSDKPPPAVAKATAPVATAAPGANTGAPAPSGGRLPLALSKAAKEFPVVLYSGKDCAPCTSGRNMLISRGIPFTEKTVDNNESAVALKQLSGQTSIPLLTVGTQQLQGYSDATWSQYLNAAGYPKESALPRGYRNPGPTPLAEAKAAVATAPAGKTAAAPEAPGEAAAPEREVPVAPPNSGIRF
jgi:glutaredoxin